MVDREIRDRLEAALNEQGQCPYMGTRRWLPHHGERRSRAPMASMTIPPAIDRFGMRREPPPGDLCRYKTRQRPSVTGRWPHCMKGDIATLRDSETYRPRYSLVSCGQA